MGHTRPSEEQKVQGNQLGQGIKGEYLIGHEEPVKKKNRRRKDTKNSARTEKQGLNAALYVFNDQR